MPLAPRACRPASAAPSLKVTRNRPVSKLSSPRSSAANSRSSTRTTHATGSGAADGTLRRFLLPWFPPNSLILLIFCAGLLVGLHVSLFWSDRFRVDCSPDRGEQTEVCLDNHLSRRYWAPSVKQLRSLLTGALNLFLQYMFTYIEDSLIHDGMWIRERQQFILVGLRIFLGERVPRLGLYKGRSGTMGSFSIFHLSFVIA